MSAQSLKLKAIRFSSFILMWGPDYISSHNLVGVKMTAESFFFFF